MHSKLCVHRDVCAHVAPAVLFTLQDPRRRRHEVRRALAAKLLRAPHRRHLDCVRARRDAEALVHGASRKETRMTRTG